MRRSACKVRCELDDAHAEHRRPHVPVLLKGIKKLSHRDPRRRMQLGQPALFQLNSGRRMIGYTQPAECDVEIHDIHGQFTIALDEAGSNPDLVQFALAETGQRKLWTQTFTPSRDFLGDTAKAFPVMPLPIPYLLKCGHKIELSVFNQTGGDSVGDGFVVIRGVQRCSL